MITPAGAPLPPRNFTFHPNYTTASDADILVNFEWSFETASSAASDEGLIVEFAVTLTDTTDFTNTTIHTSNTSLSATLEFHKTYSITLYASRCNHTLTSETVTSNITIGM